MNVKTIVFEYLKANGYGGLLNDEECGCLIDDLMLCEGMLGANACDLCKPGYRGPDPNGDCEFLIYESKEAAEAAKNSLDADGA